MLARSSTTGRRSSAVALATGSSARTSPPSALDVNGALIGERWQVGDDCVLEVTSPRIPCRTFAGWLEEQFWVKRFTDRGTPGAYLRVIVPGRVAGGDPISVIHRPDHEVTIA